MEVRDRGRGSFIFGLSYVEIITLKVKQFSVRYSKGVILINLNWEGSRQVNGNSLELAKLLSICLKTDENVQVEAYRSLKRSIFCL